MSSSTISVLRLCGPGWERRLARRLWRRLLETGFPSLSPTPVPASRFPPTAVLAPRLFLAYGDQFQSVLTACAISTSSSSYDRELSGCLLDAALIASSLSSWLSTSFRIQTKLPGGLEGSSSFTSLPSSSSRLRCTTAHESSSPAHPRAAFRLLPSAGISNILSSAQSSFRTKFKYDHSSRLSLLLCLVTEMDLVLISSCTFERCALLIHCGKVFMFTGVPACFR